MLPEEYENKISAAQTRALKDALRALPDARDARGLRHSQASALSLAICAVLCGCRSFTAIGEWGSRCTQSMLKRLGCYFNRKKQLYAAPSEPATRRVLQNTDIGCLEAALNGMAVSLNHEKGDALAVDGKTLKGARDADNRQVHLLSAVLHSRSVTAAERATETESNEIPAVRLLLEPLDIKGGTVTLDALHTRKKRLTILSGKKKRIICSR